MSTLVQLIPVTQGKTWLALYDDGELFYFELDKVTRSATVTPLRVEFVPRPAEAD